MIIFGKFDILRLDDEQKEYLNNTLPYCKGEDVIIHDMELNNNSLSFFNKFLKELLKVAKSVRVGSQNNNGTLKVISEFFPNLYSNFKDFDNVVFNPVRKIGNDKIAIISRKYTKDFNTIKDAKAIIDMTSNKTEICANYVNVGNLFLRTRADCDKEKGIIIYKNDKFSIFENSSIKKNYYLLKKDGKTYLDDKEVSQDEIDELYKDSNVYYEESSTNEDCDENIYDFLKSNLSEKAFELFKNYENRVMKGN